MGELVLGRPALQVKTAVSLPLDMVSVMSLLYRAVPGSGLDRWLVNARRSLPRQLQDDLDLLHGFSGRLLYFMEEPIMHFDPLAEERVDASIADLLAYLETVEPATFREMAIHAIDRVHQDLGTGLAAPATDGETAWRRYIEPGLTTAGIDEVVDLLMTPEQLKQRTIRLIGGVWEHAYKNEYEQRHESLLAAEAAARSAATRGFGMAFAELTGNRLPSTLAASLNTVSRVTFCPSAHLGAFVSYINYPPDLIVFFASQNLAPRAGETIAPSLVAASMREETLPVPESNGALDIPELIGDDLLDGIRALGDPNRLRILDLLNSGELYAQEIVGRLGVAQSAVSRHLSQLERAGLVRVEPRRGMKYYAIDRDRMAALAESIRLRAR